MPKVSYHSTSVYYVVAAMIAALVQCSPRVRSPLTAGLVTGRDNEAVQPPVQVYPITYLPPIVQVSGAVSVRL